MIWFREIARGKLKFLMLAAAVGLLFFLLVFVNTLSSTLLSQFIGALENTSADVLVYGDEAQSTIAASRLTPDDVNRVGEVDGVTAAAPISVVNLDVGFNDESVDMSLWGVDPSGPGAPADVVEGTMAEPGQAVVDTSARDAGFELGAVFEVGGVEVEVVGVADNATYSVLPTAYLPNETWAELFAELFPQAPAVPVNLVAVAVTDGVDRTDIASAISELDGLQGLEPSEAASSTPGVSSIEQSFAIITGITFVIVVIVVGFFFQILTVQKLNVFTLLRAIGARTRNVSEYVMGQISFLVILGVLIGVAMLWATAVLTRDLFAIDLDPLLIGSFAAAILLATLLSGLTSIRRIRREEPATAATGEQI